MTATNSTDTIMALSTGVGGTLAIIRLSGPQAAAAITALTRKELPEPRFAQFAQLFHPATGKLLDEAVCIYFKAPNTFTGEDSAEIQMHGGRAVIQSVLQALRDTQLPGLRYAEAGEFSKRAYLNGKIDLTKAEAIADLISAETESQAELALVQLGGALHDQYERWRHQVIRILAYAEAHIDFVDEEDVPPEVFATIIPQIEKLITDLRAHLDDKGLGERLREGFVVTLIGAPNAGKSSLLNALAKRDVAIVTPTAGTTRDMIEVPLNLSGLPVIIVDTAGLRDTDDAIEAEGVRRARARAAAADLVLALFDATLPDDITTRQAAGNNALAVYTKSDLLSDASQVPSQGIVISTKTGGGMQDLLEKITERLREQIAPLQNRETPLLTRARHRDTAQQALDHLQRCIANINDAPIELTIEDLRLAARDLGRLTGRVDVEDLLDVIFRDFCIGK
jgi:tRNA modification GTPase